MYGLRKWIIIRFGIQVRPPNNSDDLCLLFCRFPSSMLLLLQLTKSVQSTELQYIIYFK